MSDFFTTAFFVLMVLHSFSVQAITTDETEPLLGKIHIYYQSTEENGQPCDCLLKVVNEENDNHPTYWILSNASKTPAYLQKTDESKLKTIDAKGATPKLQKNFIKNNSIVSAFLFIKSHQESNPPKSSDPSPSTTYQTINQGYFAPNDTLSAEDSIAYSLNKIREKIEKTTAYSSPIEFTLKENIWCEYLKNYCCLGMLAKAFGHSEPSKQSEKLIRPYYNGT